ncbi:MAG: threonine/serine dehydratase [Candidatus Bathyarchaeia archaeon]
MREPVFRDVLEARKRIKPYLLRTPLLSYGGLSKLLGCNIYVKHENVNPTGAFKIRGGINLVSQLSPEERERGVITASTGNHGQSIALASKIFGAKAIICVPWASNPDKLAEIRRLGAQIIEEGREYEDAKLHAERVAEEEGYRYIHSGNEPHLIAGVATYTLEILEEQPALDYLFVPVGGGSGASGAGIVIDSISPETKLIGVQSEKAPSVYLSWREGEIVSTESADTMADGLATRRAFKLPLRIIRKHLDDFVLVSEEAIKRAINTYVEEAHTIAEGAGAAPLAAALKIKDRLQDKKVGLVLSGGNLTSESLKEILNNY